MFRVFRRRASASALLEVAMDGVLGFIAVVLSAVTIDMIPHATVAALLAHRGVMLTAVGFAAVMALLHSFVGLYRHTGIGPLSAAVRIALALVVGGYLTYLVLKQADVQGHPARLVSYSALYLLAALLLVRGSISVVRHAFGKPRVIVVGTGPEAMEVARDLAAGGRQLVGFYPAAPDTDMAVLDSLVLERSAGLPELAREHGVREIIVAVREQSGGALPIPE